MQTCGYSSQLVKPTTLPLVHSYRTWRVKGTPLLRKELNVHEWIKVSKGLQRSRPTLLISLPRSSGMAGSMMAGGSFVAVNGQTKLQCEKSPSHASWHMLTRWPLALQEGSSALCQALLTSETGGGASIVADHLTMQQVVLGYMVPVALWQVTWLPLPCYWQHK